MDLADCTTLRAELDRLRHTLANANLARNTILGYRFDWENFEKFCARVALPSLPASSETLELYIADQLLAGKKISTIYRRVSAINQRHRGDGLPSPFTAEVSRLLAGAKRTRPDRLRQVRPLSVEHVRKIAALLPQDGTAIADRDLAIVLTGFASACRSATLAALTLADLSFCRQGLELYIARSKTDQAGKGRVIAVPFGKCTETCPVAAVRQWLNRRGDHPGRLFTHANPPFDRPLDPETFGQIIKRCAGRIGLDPGPYSYSSHSMRSGMVTVAGENGASLLLIAHVTGHRDLETLRRYFRHSDAWGANASGYLGL